MTIKEALTNIDNVISSAPLNRESHVTLSRCIQMISERCQRADELENLQMQAKKPTLVTEE